MKKCVITLLCLLGVICILAPYANSQEIRSYQKNGISLKYPAGSKISESGQPGNWDQVGVTTPTGNFVLLTVYCQKIDVNTELSSYKSAFEAEHKKNGAVNIKTGEIPDGPPGWRIYFTLNKTPFLCDIYYAGSPGGKQVIMIQQYPLRSGNTEVPNEVSEIINSIEVK